MNLKKIRSSQLFLGKPLICLYVYFQEETFYHFFPWTADEKNM